MATVERPGVTRGQFLKSAAGAAAGLLALDGQAYGAQARASFRAGPQAARGGQTGTANTLSFRSQPDLHPPRLSVVDHRGSPGGPSDDLWFLGPWDPNNGSQAGPMITDSRGNLVWFRPLGKPGAFSTNFRVQHYGGQPVLTWWEGKSYPPGYGKGEGVIMDRSYREVARVRAGNGRQAELHEFTLTAEGSALISCFPQTVEADLSSIGGPKNGQVLESIIQEVDVRSGQVLLEWRSLDHIPVTDSYLSHREPYDYLHINSIAVMPDGNLLLSGRHTWALYKIERRTGQVMWRLGGKRSQFEMRGDSRFAWQHDARPRGQRTITMFDDGAGWAITESQSRGLVLDVDVDHKTVAPKRSYRHSPPLLAFFYGSMQTLPQGEVTIGWGELSVFSHLRRGALVQDARLPGGYFSYRGFRLPWNGRPHTPPALAVSRKRTGGQTTLYASWNGATAVSAWQVATGPHPAQLRPAATARRRGFETAIAVHTSERYGAVTALDSGGHPLGSSGPIALRRG